jgi:hypothetical protein
MKRMLVASLALILAACGLDKADQFRNGVTKADQVKINLPASATAQQGLEGDTAEFYVFTRAVTGMINGGTLLVLGIVKSVTDHEPTSIKGNVAVWGPYTDALSPNTWKLTVTKVDEVNFSYSLEGKGKSEADTAFRVILSGSHKVASKDFGNGTFLIDWNEAQKLPEHGAEVGTAEFIYSHLSASDDATLTVAFRQVKDADTAKLVDADYAYVAHPASGGAFEFKITKDMDTDATRPGLETMSIKSRWEQTGAGRSDVKATGGDLKDTVFTATQCWDLNFKSRYLDVPWDPSQAYGAESACAFKTAEYSSIKL